MRIKFDWVKLKKTIKNLPKPKCKCGNIGKFKKIGEGYNQYDNNNNPIIIDLIQCSKCDKIYNEREFANLERIEKIRRT